MTTNFAIDSDNGFLLSQNQIVLLEGVEAIAVNCTTEVQTLTGEDPYFQLKGMPNFQTIWEGSPNVPDFETSLRDALLNINGVFNATNFIYDLNDNILTYSIEIQTFIGFTTIEGILNA